MRLLPVPLHPPLELMRRVIQNLEVESQLRARRNALIACTALAQRRAELTEVEESLARLTPANRESHPSFDPAERINVHRSASVAD
jgi:hypothetical protein